MAPVVQGISDCLSKALSPLAEFLIVGSISGDVLFVNSEGTHQTPFIMVAAQPYLSNVVKLTILSDFSGVDMAVIVQNRSVLCVIVEQLLCCFCFQQKIFVHKCFHIFPLFLSLCDVPVFAGKIE